MTDKIDIEQLRADMEAGTQGPWHSRVTHPKNACIEVFENVFGICTLYHAPREYSRERADGTWSDQPVRDANARRIARLPDLEQAYLGLHEGCARYLKEFETPAERLSSNHREILALMKLLEREKRNAEVWVKAARDDEAKLAQQGDQIEALHAENRKLREALEQIEMLADSKEQGRIATAALAEGETE